MKKLYFLFLSLVMVTVHSQSQVTTSDKDQLVQKCLTFQPLVDKIPAQVQVLMTDYYIFKNGMEGDFSNNLIMNGKKVSFLNKGDFRPTKPFFIFFTLNVDNDKAFVRYYFTYTNDGQETTIPITIDFVRTNSVWQIFQYTI